MLRLERMKTKGRKDRKKRRKNERKIDTKKEKRFQDEWNIISNVEIFTFVPLQKIPSQAISVGCQTWWFIFFAESFFSGVSSSASRALLASLSFMVQVCRFDFLVAAQAPNGRLGNFYAILRLLVYFKFFKSPRHLSHLFPFLGTTMVAFFILASGCEVYSSLFSNCCLFRGGNKLSIKFAGKMFKPTSSSISSMVGTLWTVNFCMFFVLT